MEKALVTYSLIRALYDEGRDYVDSFWPFALRVLPADKSAMAPQTVADLVAERFGLSVPVHTTQTLLERAKHRGKYVARHDQAYALTEKGVDYLRRMETPRSVERRIASFVEAACVFLARQKEVFADRAYTQAIIERVVQRATELFSFVVERPYDQPGAQFKADEEEVLAFFQHVEESDPRQYETLKDLLLGSTLAGLLERTDIADATRSFRPTTLYLDTNFLLSILELRFPMECRPALELLRLLNRNARFTLRVFDFTLEEMFGLLRGFQREGKKYPADVPVASLYAAMRSKGWTPSQVTELIARIEQDLGTLGITVLKTGIRIDDVELPEGDMFARLRTYKPEQEDRGRLHDVQAVAWVAQERSRDARRVEDAEVFFLTEDGRLSKFAYIEGGHRAAETLSEVMPDRLLTNLLWLKDPETLEQIPVEAMIAMHSRDLFIDKTVWLRFFGVLENLRGQGRLDDDAASVLLYDAQVQKDLVKLGVGKIGELDEEWVMGRLEDAREAAEWRQERTLRRRAEEIQEAYEARVAKEEQRHREEILELSRRLQLAQDDSVSRKAEAARAYARIKERAKETATRLVAGLKILAIAALGLIAYLLVPFVVGQWEVAEPIITILQWAPLILFAMGWRLDPFKSWTQLKIRIEEGLMHRSLRDLPVKTSDTVVGAPMAQSGGDVS